MEEKKLTDEEIIKALECCIEDNLCKACVLYTDAGCIKKRNVKTLDLIHRLQERVFDYENLEKHAKKLEFENVEQKAEIERLTEEIDQRREMMHRMDCNYATELQKNADFKKQVDELTEQLRKLKLAHTSLCEECADYCPRVPQAVKDTAKEILQELYETPHEYHEKKIFEIAKRKGVEVEWWNTKDGQ